MKRKRLGEILQDRARSQLRTSKKLFEEQQGKVVGLGELILEPSLVDKASPVKAIEEVSRVTINASKRRSERQKRPQALTASRFVSAMY